MVKRPSRKSSWRQPVLRCNDATLARLRELGAVQCDIAEAAQAMSVDAAALSDFFADFPQAGAAFDQAAAEAREQLRAAQFKLAQTSTTMAIFLGKHYLGQDDRRELDTSAQAVQFAELLGAGQRVRAKLAVFAAAPHTPGDREDGGPV